MKTKTEILRWLRSNLGKTACAGLTSTDTYALLTSVSLCNLISYETAPTELFEAYRHIVMTMQAHTRHLAYHAIACELDWSHRSMIWTCSGLFVFSENKITTRCLFES